MRRTSLLLIMAGLVGAPFAAAPAPAPALAQPGATAIGPPGSATKPTAPAFKPGMVVSDRSGAQVGVVQTIAETPTGGLNVVTKIDGKLVGLAASTLQLNGNAVSSLQTKDQMLSTAGAEP